MTIKALTWFCTHAGVNAFDTASHSLVQSWRNSKVPRDRMESFPLPLYVVIQWERRLLQAGCTPTERLVLGGFLLMIWGGLRFCETERCSTDLFAWSTGPTVVNAFCINCPWPMWESYKCNSMKCHPCAGAMHGHEYSAKCFGLLLGNKEFPTSISTHFWHGCCAQTSMEIPIRDCIGPSGIMVTGSCHYSPAWKVCLWQRWHSGYGELPSFPAWKIP